MGEVMGWIAATVIVGGVIVVIGLGFAWAAVRLWRKVRQP
jgi:hypothetical protein